MIPPACKRLAEVDFPIGAVSRHAAREKSVRHGHPSTLHLWWARQPLASSRAMTLALLLPDPADDRCPHTFRVAARKILRDLPNNARADADLERLRGDLLRFIGDFSDWDRTNDTEYLDAARALIRVAHGEAPLFVDPFAGGGSMPLEALRLGCRAHASELNPVACLILQTVLEDVPRRGPSLPADLRELGAIVASAARVKLADLYPSGPDGTEPITYLWARTARCESTDCGGEFPLARTFWLTQRETRSRAVRYVVEHVADAPPCLRLEVFNPATATEVPHGTISKARAKCPCCERVLAPDRVRAQLREQRGGADVIFDGAGKRTGGAILLAVVTAGRALGREYRSPTDADYAAVHAAQQAAGLRHARSDCRALDTFPTEPLRPVGALGFRVLRYGMTNWGDLFTARQKLALSTLAEECRHISGHPTAELLALAFGRCVEQCSSLVRWRAAAGSISGTFGRLALPMMWDFAEIAPFQDKAPGFRTAVEWVASVVDRLSGHYRAGKVTQADATHASLPQGCADVWFTGPPYYDAIPYADLSDFFFVWLKRALPNHPLLRDPADPTNPLTPKYAEIVQDESKRHAGRPKDKQYFETAMAQAFAEGRRVIRDDGIGSVVFAHKTTEGWEALLSGLIDGGWTITASWPIATERPGRMRARDSAALATSVHLVCRPRRNHAVGDWAEVLGELPGRVTTWMQRLQAEDIRGADLVFACIGPALEIFSRYKVVETPEGRTVPLSEYLTKVWEIVGRSALEQILGEPSAPGGIGGALEEDARLTALFLWTLQPELQKSAPAPADNDDQDASDDAETDATAPPRAYTLVFDVVRRFAQPLGIHLDAWEGRILKTHKGTVRLLTVAERAQQLFGESDTSAIAAAIERDHNKSPQLDLFPEPPEPPRLRARAHGKPRPARPFAGQVTTLDRLHASMLLQRAGQTNALRALLAAEVGRGTEFRRLANALSALYSRDAEEKRLLDAMLLAMPR